MRHVMHYGHMAQSVPAILRGITMFAKTITSIIMISVFAIIAMVIAQLPTHIATMGVLNIAGFIGFIAFTMVKIVPAAIAVAKQ
jgi:hypothetical protein